MDFKELPSQYDHSAAQQKWYSFWEEQGYFPAEAGAPRPPRRARPHLTTRLGVALRAGVSELFFPVPTVVPWSVCCLSPPVFVRAFPSSHQSLARVSIRACLSRSMPARGATRRLLRLSAGCRHGW